ncbi:MAG: HAD family phosphatase [Deltaproteobacteria bacterium]|jgi:putative hydrolase of the HAD superfamily|nr:HAD family phosphatase [Deltaproteobacteria bacterium]
MTIETVIFDLGHVLVDLDGKQVTARLAALTGKNTDELRRVFGAIELPMAAFEMGRLNAVEFYHIVIDAYELSADRYSFADFRRDWCGIMVPVPEMAQLFHACCEICTTCVLSNTNELHWTWVAERYDLLQRARYTLTSYQCGLYKPQREIYELALQRFEVKDPAAAVFIDDRPENIDGAVAVGMKQSFRHEDAGSTHDRLRELGLGV